ncbi:hypothetical protein Pmani_039781 [Petrolisthes manimaculis]|uniref:PLAT domain-containing protein n=1 Tax=Petrolisthes manimaculis TaxID=1843537 RepID=A0AAE1NDA1_9EUCA|nr:hypothetical protein Pmani_039781 [Petrolisthes manimaculis]
MHRLTTRCCGVGRLWRGTTTTTTTHRYKVLLLTGTSATPISRNTLINNNNNNNTSTTTTTTTTTPTLTTTTSPNLITQTPLSTTKTPHITTPTTTTTPYLIAFRPYTHICGGDIDKTIGGESSTSQQSHKGHISTPVSRPSSFNLRLVSPCLPRVLEVEEKRRYQCVHTAPANKLSVYASCIAINSLFPCRYNIYRTYFSDSGCDQCESVIESGVPGGERRSVQRQPLAGVDRENNIAPKQNETGEEKRREEKLENPPTTNMKKAFQLMVKTGDQEGAGTDANVWVVLEDEEGRESSKVKLDKILYNDLERSKRDTYSLECPSEFGQVARLKLKRDNRGLADDWFCDYIHVEDRRGPKRKTSKEQQKLQSSSKGIRNFLGSNYLRENAVITPTTEKTVYFFPIHRWVSPKHEYLFHEYGSSLPHLDPCLEARRSDLEKKRESYKYIVHAEGMMAQEKE